MVVRMRATRAHRDNRRSHHALSNPTIASCECGAKHMRHRACDTCGKYRGRQVIDVVARTEKMQKRTKRKEAFMKETGQEKEAPTEVTEVKKEKKATKKTEKAGK